MSKYRRIQCRVLRGSVRASVLGAGLLLGLACLPVPAARAQGTTVLTFDFSPNAGLSNGSLMPQDYGDNVTAATMGAYSYGGSSPFTPNVQTLYSGGSIGPAFWTTGYGDLTNVAYGQENQLLLVTLLPQAGYSVRLNSFDLAGWPNTDYTINAVSVFGSGGSLLFQQNNAAIEGDAGHTAFNFTGLNITTTDFLTIQIDALNLGNLSDNIGIDNISFTQVPIASAAPEPGTLALLGMVALPLGGVLARRRAR